MPVLEVSNLKISFTQYSAGLKQTRLQVIHGMDVAIAAGEIVAVIGSSGSGKSLLAHAIMGILPRNANMEGTLLYNGEPLSSARQAELRGKEIVLIPQSVNYLDPLIRVGEQVRSTPTGKLPVEKMKQVFKHYQLQEKVAKLYPFQLSGGMARRILVSTATISQPKLIIADEPTPGLNPQVMETALQQFRELADQGSAMLLISHDINSALTIADKVAVIYAGTIVEIANAKDFNGDGEQLRHPYTKALWRALPQNQFTPIKGAQPYANSLAGGCLFAPRCSSMVPADCSVEQPLRTVRDGKVRCIHAT